MRRKSFFFTAVLIFALDFTVYANIYNRPRSVKVLPTKHFDFIFPSGAEKTVLYLSEEADSFFEKTAESVSLQKSFRLPVAISLDSDTMSVEYTPSPYNRITVFASPFEKENSYRDEILLESFREKVCEAVISSKRSKFWQTLHSITGFDALQPAAILNIPSGFLEGAVNLEAYRTENENGIQTGGILKDGFSLSVLSEAKAEGKFPSWEDVSGGRDIHSKEISKIASSAFAAYLQKRFGFEKFKEFYEESGKVHFFRITQGIFKKVYRKPVKEIWSDFIEEIPSAEKKEKGERIFSDDEGSRYSFLLAGKTDLKSGRKDCLIYYDQPHSQVRFLSEKKDLLNPEKTQDVRQKLFSATEITSLSLSEDKKYLALSYTSTKSNRSLSKNETKIFDTETKKFLSQTYRIRCGTVFSFSLDRKAVAGFSRSENDGMEATLEIFPLDFEEHKTAFYSKKLPSLAKPEAILNAGTGKLLLVYYCGGKCVLELSDFFYGTESFFHLPYKARNFKNEDDGTISFTFAEENPYISQKRGILEIIYEAEDKTETGIGLKNRTELKGKNLKTRIQVEVQEEVFSGGICDSVLSGKDEHGKRKLYFSSRKTNREELRFCRESDFMYKKAEDAIQIQKPESQEWKNAEAKTENGFPEEHQVSKYKVLKYSTRGLLIPMFPISKLDIDSAEFAPGLGATYITNTDPLENITNIFSACAGFIDTTQETFTLKDGYTISATTNTSVFPFDLALGGLWHFTDSGQYNVQGLIETKWNSVAGLPHNVFSFGIRGLWNASTTYLDYENESVTELSGWPKIKDAYNTFSLKFSVNYSSLRQHGQSGFEKLGIDTSLSFISVYDHQKRLKNENQNRPLLLTYSYEFGFSLPYIIPVFGIENWVISMPLTLYTNWFSENGTALESYAEVLLAGYEAQKGIPFANIFVKRIGLKAGYDFSLKYDTLRTKDPDIRDLHALYMTFRDSEISDYFYFTVETELSPSVGKFSSAAKVKLGSQFRLHYRENKGTFRMILKLDI